MSVSTEADGKKETFVGMSAETRERDLGMDNLRCVLLFLVVLGHLMETFGGGRREILYRVIYSFHMPFFLFLTGCFARFRPERLIRHLLFPYAVFQVLYLLFQYCVIGQKDPLTFQFTTPYWLLWYLMTAFWCCMLLPFFGAGGSADRKKAAAITGGLFALAIAAGFDGTIGYYLSLSRTLCFLPFFAAGWYAANVPAFKEELDGLRKGPKRIAAAVCIALLILVTEAVLLRMNLQVGALFGSFSYRGAGFNAGTRLLLFACAGLWILFGLLVTPGKKIPVLSEAGRNTMPVYLLHGFIERLCIKYHIFRFSELQNLSLAVLLTLLILLLFGNRKIGGMFRRIF